MNDTENITAKVCNLNYLAEMMGGKKKLITEILDAFIVQVPEELTAIRNAILSSDFPVIRNFAHTMKSSVSIMGITSLTPVLQEMENLGTQAMNISRIGELNIQLNLICKTALEEIENEKLKFI
jgi:HPt (histidine-containing phosphotransfer) domain-containing protein